MASRDVTELEDGVAAIVIDERSWPLWTSTWFGAATESLVDRYFDHASQLLDRARADRERMALITDTYATRAPSAKVRNRIGTLSRAQSERLGDLVVASFTVIENPLIRGVLTALSWIDPTMARTTNVASYEHAVNGCVGALKAAGIAPPAVLPSRHRDIRRSSRTG